MSRYIFILDGETPESAEHDLAKEIESVANKYGLESHLDDVEVKMNGEQCRHGNSWASNCSDCDEENTSTSVDSGSKKELKTALMTYILPEVKNLIIDYCVSDTAKDLASKWSKKDYELVTEGGLGDEITDEIMYRLSNATKQYHKL